MEKRTLIAFALAMLVIVLWFQLFPPPHPPSGKGQGASPADSGAGSAAGASGSTGPESGSRAHQSSSGGQAVPSPESAPALRAKIEAAAEEKVEIDTGLARVVLTNRGGHALSWTLHRYTDNSGKPYELVSSATARANPPTFPLDFMVDDEATTKALREALFVVGRQSAPDGGHEVRLRWSDGKGLEAEKTFIFRPGTYFCDVIASVRRAGQPVKSSVVWGPGIGEALQKRRSSTFDYLGRAVVGSELTVQRIPPSSVKGIQILQEQEAGAAVGSARVGWAGLEEQYFAAIFLPGDEAAAVPGVVLYPFDVLPAPGEKLERHVAVGVPVGGGGVALRLYAGPKEYDRLKAIGHGTQQLVYFSQPAPLIGSVLSPVIGMLAQGLYLCLRWLHEIVPNWGVAIILLTTAIKVAFYPLTQHSFVKMRQTQQKMQAVQPKVKALKEKYRKQKGAEARQKLNQETMELYKREGINPLGGMTGCLPLLIQLPFLYAFYNVLTVSIELRKAPFFGWITDLTQKDPYFVTPILMGGTMFLQQRMAMTKITDPQQRAQQRMMLFMPVMFTAMFLNLPSGLTLYWFVSNLLQIGQQMLINRQADRLLAPPEGDDPDGRDRVGRLKAAEKRSGRQPEQSEGGSTAVGAAGAASRRNGDPARRSRSS